MDRDLGDIEYLYWLMDHHCRTNFVVVADVGGPLSRSVLAQALDEIQAVHPALRARIEVDGKQVAFRACRGRPIPVRVLDMDLGGSKGASSRKLGRPDWIQVAEEEQSARFQTEEGPLMRCAWLRQDDLRSRLLITFHHSIADAACGVRLVKDLVEAAGSIESGHKPRLEPVAPALPVSRRIPPAFRGVAGVAREIWLVLRQLGQILRRGVPKAEPNDKVVPFDERRDRFLSLSFDRDQTAALVARARSHDTTVHGALAAAQLMAVRAELPGSGAVSLAASSLINLRGLLEPREPDATMAPLISLAATFHRLSRDLGLWDLARSVRAELETQVRAGSPFLILPRLAFRLRRRHLHLRAEHGSRDAFRWLERFLPQVSLVSNIGRIPFSWNFGGLTLEGLHFLFALSSSARLGSSASTFRDQLSWSFTYADPSISHERAERIAWRARSLLLEATGIGLP